MKTIKLLIIILCSWMIIHLLFMFQIGLQTTDQNADAILIFGNKVETNGQPSRRLQSRLDEGLRLFNNNQAHLIVVSGGFGKEGFDEAEVMHNYLVDKGVSSLQIIQDPNGINTYATAKNLQSISQEHQIQSVIIVSQYYHLLRAKLALKKFDFKDIHSSHTKMSPELRDLYSIPREILGYYVYQFKKY